MWTNFDLRKPKFWSDPKIWTNGYVKTKLLSLKKAKLRRDKGRLGKNRWDMGHVVHKDDDDCPTAVLLP